MKRRIPALILAAGLALSWPPAAGEEKTGEKPMLKAGDAAPAFTLAGSDGGTHSLADHAGKRAVVLAWFPKAFTGG